MTSTLRRRLSARRQNKVPPASLLEQRRFPCVIGMITALVELPDAPRNMCHRSDVLDVVTRADADNWLTYHNDRYGTTIDYPDMFKTQRPPDSDDGRDFKTADGADFLVAASYNALDFDLPKFRDFIVKGLSPDQVVTYQASGDNWFVLSGTKGADIFYERYALSHKRQMTEEF
jgi:hypothetical protein